MYCDVHCVMTNGETFETNYHGKWTDSNPMATFIAVVHVWNSLETSMSHKRIILHTAMNIQIMKFLRGKYVHTICITQVVTQS